MVVDPALAGLFTPPHPLVGRYEVLTSPAPLSEVIQEVGNKDWPVELLPPLEAFGNAGSYDKGALARLYVGRRVSVSRGWIQRSGHFESLTLVSPYPDASLSRLNQGTLVLRFIICCP